MHINDLSHQIIGCAMRVHSQLGSGLLKSAYEECMAYELSKACLSFEKQKGLPLVYETVRLDCGYRLDLLVPAKSSWRSNRSTRFTKFTSLRC